MARPTESSRFSPTLGTKIFLLTAALLVLAIGTSVLVTRLLGDRVADRAVTENLVRSTSVQSTLADDRLDQLYLRAESIGRDPNFVSYVAEAIESNDALSLTDQLGERQAGLGFTFAIVLDAEGQVVARTDQRSGDDFTGQTIFATAVDSGEYSADGIWLSSDELHYAVLVPLVTANTLQGYLVASYAIDDATALELRQATNSEVSFVLEKDGKQVAAATTLDTRDIDELLGWMEQDGELVGQAGDSDQCFRVNLGQRGWLALGRPLVDVSGERIGTVVNLGSLEEALKPFDDIAEVLGWVGLVVLLLALAASYWLPRRILEPMRQLASASAAAAEGSYDQEISGTDRPDEVGQLAAAFSTLLSELREKRDMQVYLTELTRTMPEQEGAASEVTPAEQRRVTLIGVELRSYNANLPPMQAAAETLENLTQDLRRLTRAVMIQGGRLEAAVGHRAIAIFDGDRRSERAIGAAAEILARGPQEHLALAMVSGLAVSGTVNLQNRPTLALTGDSIDHLESLMRVARPGTLVMSQVCHQELAEIFAQMNISTKAHGSNISDEPLYTLPFASVKSLGSPEVGVTQQMTQASTLGAATATMPSGGVTLAGIGLGAVLGDRFEILSELGVGGMGVVYKAMDRKLDELVAVKMLKEDVFGGDPAALGRLKDELKLARKISHANVLRTFDFGEADGFPFISMEFVRGVTLNKLLKESGRLPLSAGLHMARQLCRGLAAAHEQAVLHRDIKPENMIIEPTGNVKLMDFGIAQPIERSRTGHTNDGAIVGTPFYLAPEQLKGMEPDVRADIYACGVVFFEIFTGELPFPASGNVMQIITRKLNEEPMPASSFWPEIPPELERIIMGCLESDRENRVPTVRDLLAQLEALRA